MKRVFHFEILAFLSLLILPYACFWEGGLDEDEDYDGFSPVIGDCSDKDPDINTKAFDIPYEGVDQD